MPVPATEESGRGVSDPFRSYSLALAKARADFASYLQSSGQHHFFVSGAEEPVAKAVDDDDPATADESDEFSDEGSAADGS